MTEPDAIVWLRDLDGTGSMHPCAPHDTGAIPYFRDEESEVVRLRDALLPFASLETPAKPSGNAGFYSLWFSDIERAQRAAQVDTLPKGGDAKQAPGESQGSAVAEGDAP